MAQQTSQSEMKREMEGLAPGPGVVMPVESAKAGFGGAIVGGIVGALLGLIIGAIAFGGAAGMIASVLGIGVAGAVAGGIANGIVKTDKLATKEDSRA